MKLVLTVILLFPVALAYGADAGKCPIEGERIHWIADYCMSRLETDDEIAASSCINAEIRIAHADECVAKRHYKRALCQLVISRKSRPGGVEECVNDGSFAGSTVRSKGVGR